jgi:hypothetical protein
MAADFTLIKAGDGLTYQPVQHAFPPVFSKGDKPRVILTSVKIGDDNLWANGLFQNVFVIYKLIESLGMEPYILVDDNENNKEAKVHKSFRMLDFKQYISAPFQVLAYIEIGMSCEPGIRRIFRNSGAKVAKLYLGNILNIDIETITYLPGQNFSHHVAGEIDEIWVSPHYDLHAEYAGSINGLCGRTRVAPYVWDPFFVESLGHVYKGASLSVDAPRTFVVMEPNISFQKNSLISIMALEAYYRRHPGRVKEAIIVNGVRFKENAFFMTSVAPHLTIYKAGLLQLMPRAHIINFVQAYPEAIALQHQVNNEYNYSFLEWMTLGFPVIHNAPRFKEHGYYYEGNNFDAAADQIERVVEHHGKNTESYRAHARQLAWRFSPYNPENMVGWLKLILEK